MKEIDTRGWAEFNVIDLFDRIERGKGSGAGSFMDGDVPYIAASFANNGYVRDIEDIDGSLTSDGNCITLICNGNGGIGRNTYQAEPFVGSSDLQVAYHPRLNQWNGMFLVACLDKSIERYNYSFAWKRNGEAFEAETVFLPATLAGDPDWDYMEQTMREIFAQQEHELDELIAVAASSGPLVDTSDWGEFRVGSLFPKVERATRRTVNSYAEGDVPYVTNSTFNNGITGYLEPKSSTDIERGRCITINTVDGYAFWQEEDFLANSSGNGLLMLRSEALNRETALFLSAAITVALDASYAVMITKGTVQDVTIRLPSTPSDAPDWERMAQTMRGVMAEREAALDSLQALAEV